jgi:hypothetical protein
VARRGLREFLSGSANIVLYDLGYLSRKNRNYYNLAFPYQENPRIII